MMRVELTPVKYTRLFTPYANFIISFLLLKIVTGLYYSMCRFITVMGFLRLAREKNFEGPLQPCCRVTKLQTLQMLQNRAARIVPKKQFWYPSVDLTQSLNWLTVRDIIRSETAATVHKMPNGLVPEYLSDLFEKKSKRNVWTLRNIETDLSIPLRKIINRQRVTSFRGPKLWNNLELDVKQAPSLAIFKKRIKLL